MKKCVCNHTSMVPSCGKVECVPRESCSSCSGHILDPHQPRGCAHSTTSCWEWDIQIHPYMHTCIARFAQRPFIKDVNKFKLNSNSKNVYCHVSTFSTTVQKTYIQYKCGIRTQYDIIHNINYMAMGAWNPYRLVSSISDTQFLLTIKRVQCAY